MAVNEVANHFVKTFEASAIHLVQQKLSKFRGKVTEKNKQSEKHSFRVVAPRGAMVDRVGVPGTNAAKRPATAFTDTVFNDRVTGTVVKTTADSFSKPDVRRMLENPESEIYKAMLPQVGRAFDDVIIAAMNGNALDNLGTVNAFGAGSAVHTIGGVAQAMDFASVNSLLEAFGAEEVDPDEEKFIGVSPNAVKKLLAEPKATSVDYVNAETLMGGKLIQGWMGFTWILTNRAAVVAGLQRYYNAWTRDSMGLLTLQDVEFNSGPSPTQSFDTIMQLSIDIGAVRIQDQKCKRLHILES
jgi:hypothetical protein